MFGPAPGFGPVLDSTYIPDLPETLYREGRFHKELKAFIVGNAANEVSLNSLSITCSPDISSASLQGMGLSSDEGMPEAFGELVRRVLHTATNETIAEIQSHYDFGDIPEKLAWDWTMDTVFSCNAANVAAAYKDAARRYIFSVEPATHGQELTCTASFSPLRPVILGLADLPQMRFTWTRRLPPSRGRRMQGRSSGTYSRFFMVEKLTGPSTDLRSES